MKSHFSFTSHAGVVKHIQKQKFWT